MLAACAPTVIPAGESVRAPLLSGDKYVAADGTALPLAVWNAENGPPKAVILGLHGFGDYRYAFEEPAAIWAKAGTGATSRSATASRPSAAHSSNPTS